MWQFTFRFIRHGNLASTGCCLSTHSKGLAVDAAPHVLTYGNKRALYGCSNLRRAINTGYGHICKKQGNTVSALNEYIKEGNASSSSLGTLQRVGLSTTVDSQSLKNGALLTKVSSMFSVLHSNESKMLTEVEKRASNEVACDFLDWQSKEGRARMYGTVAATDESEEKVTDNAEELPKEPEGQQKEVPEISWKLMTHIFISSAIPMIGFGLMDQFVMIRAGDLIDTTIGVTLGLATLSAAAVGQLCSDTCGVLSGSTMEALAGKCGFETPAVQPDQRNLLTYKLCNTSGAVFGVILGCLLGMTQLFFMDLRKAERLKKQKELDTIFEMVMSDGPKLFRCERGTLFVYDKKNNEIWSKAVFGLDQAIRLRKNKTNSFTTWVLENKKILNCPDAYLDSRFNPVYDRRYKYRTCSVLAAPIIDKSGESMAVLMFINKDKDLGGVFTCEDERMLEMMCNHIQIFMEKYNYGAEDDTQMISIHENGEYSHQNRDSVSTTFVDNSTSTALKKVKCDVINKEEILQDDIPNSLDALCEAVEPHDGCIYTRAIPYRRMLEPQFFQRNLMLPSSCWPSNAPMKMYLAASDIRGEKSRLHAFSLTSATQAFSNGSRTLLGEDLHKYTPLYRWQQK